MPGKEFMLTKEEILGKYDYDPDTGYFHYLKDSKRGIKAGDVAGFTCKKGYIHLHFVGYGNSRFKAHRVAWFISHGVWPEEVDHIDGNRSNNAIKNLRACNRYQNTRNSSRPITNTSGVKGVSFDKQRKKWHVQIKKDKKMYRAHFEDFDLACEFADFLREELHGEYARYE